MTLQDKMEAAVAQHLKTTVQFNIKMLTPTAAAAICAKVAEEYYGPRFDYLYEALGPASDDIFEMMEVELGDA